MSDIPPPSVPAIPLQPVPTNFGFRVVNTVSLVDGEEQQWVLIDLVTQQGSQTYWFDVVSWRDFLRKGEGLEVTEIITARTVPRTLRAPIQLRNGDRGGGSPLR